MLDIGCAEGNQARELRKQGCACIGIDYDEAALVRCVQQGVPAVRGRAECLPIPDASVGGIVCKVVLPFTRKREVVKEFGRVLAPGARGFVSTHASGYYLRYLVVGSFRDRMYSARVFLATWLYVLTGRRLPGFLGDTIYQSVPRLLACYREAGLGLERQIESPRFMGLRVFIYHIVSKPAGPPPR